MAVNQSFDPQYLKSIGYNDAQIAALQNSGTNSSQQPASATPVAPSPLTQLGQKYATDQAAKALTPDVATTAADGSVATSTPAFDIGGASIAGTGAAIGRGIKGISDITNSKLAPQDRTKATLQDARMGVADYFSGGLAELGKIGIDKIFGDGTVDKAFGKLDDFTGMSKILGSENPDHYARDREREQLESNGFVGKDNKLHLADGSTFDIGQDGHDMLNNTGKNIDGRNIRYAYDVDFSNPLAKDNVGAFQALAQKELGPNASQKAISDFTGYISNAATQGAKDQAGVLANLASISKGSGPSQTLVN